MEQITVVIGDRLGKGQKVAAGVEKAGGRAVVVPGMAADMKLGDVMKAENATFGISNVLGFGFMDKEELGERLVQAWQKKYGA
ncbi:MAG: SFCGS family glycine-rich protein [Enterobacter asburiae]|nr:SFCGS family glycine-rich protein [Enterobacter asburiae]